MTEREFLLEKYGERKENYREKNKAFYENPAIARIEPFKIADGLYYVGDIKVCIHLVDTDDGLILFDSGYLGAAHLLIDSIWRAGFDPQNVRWIIHTHGHSDHFGASDAFRAMYGTKLAISKVDAEKLRRSSRTPIDTQSFPYAKVPAFDYEIEDGEVFVLGNKKIRCVLTPGHTMGVLSFFFDVTENGKTYRAGLYGGAGTNAMTLPNICYNDDPEDMPLYMLRSIEKVWNEKVEIHLGNHPYNNHTLEKREKQLRDGGNPFIDSNSWHDFLSALKVKTEEIMKENAALKKEMAKTCDADF